VGVCDQRVENRRDKPRGLRKVDRRTRNLTFQIESFKLAGGWRFHDSLAQTLPGNFSLRLLWSRSVLLGWRDFAKLPRISDISVVFLPEFVHGWLI
jgi:hypothetical protein